MPSNSIGPILATGAVTFVNETVLHGQPVDWRVPIATALAAIGFSLAEKAAPEPTVILAYTVLITVLLTRTKPSVPSPTESLLQWWDTGPGKKG